MNVVYFRKMHGLCCVWFLSVISWIICFHIKRFWYTSLLHSHQIISLSFLFTSRFCFRHLKKYAGASEQRFRFFKLFTLVIFKKRHRLHYSVIQTWHAGSGCSYSLVRWKLMKWKKSLSQHLDWQSQKTLISYYHSSKCCYLSPE